MATDFRLKDQLPELTERIVRTYDEVGKINHLGHCPLPNYDEIVAAIERPEGDPLSRLSPPRGPAPRQRRLLRRRPDRRAARQAHARRSAAPCGTKPAPPSDCDTDQDFEALGQAKTMLFLEQLPELRSMLATDVQAAYDGDPAGKTLDEVIFCYPGLEAITVYRLAHELYELGVPFIPRMMTEWAHSRTGIDIHPGATIGHYFFIDHGTGVVIGETTRHRRAREALPGRDARRPELRHRRRRQPRPRPQAAPDARRRRGDLRQRHDPRRRHGRRPRLGDRLERLAHPQRGAPTHRRAGKPKLKMRSDMDAALDAKANFQI